MKLLQKEWTSLLKERYIRPTLDVKVRITLSSAGAALVKQTVLLHQ
jgi:hypothetical protein